MKFSEVAKYFTFTGHQYEPSIVLVSEQFWNKLDAGDKQILREAMAEASQYYHDISQELFDSYIEAGEKAGVTFVEVDDISEWQEAVEPLYVRFGKGMESIIEAIAEMR